MTQTHDVTLGATGYMVRAGTYTRRQDGYDQAASGRVQLFDFYGGSRRANQLERDRFWTGLGAWPAFDGQGVAAGPKRTDFAETAGTSSATATWSFAWGGNTYVVNNGKLLRVTTLAGNYNGLTLVQTLAAAVVDVALSGDLVAFAHGSGTRVSTYNLATATYTSAYVNAPKATRLAMAPSGAVYAVDTTVDRTVVTHFDTGLDAIVGTVLATDGEIVGLTNYKGGVWAITRSGIWSYNPATATDRVEGTAPRLGFSSDLSFLVTFQGELYAWIAHEVHRYDATDDVFVPLGLRGTSTNGAAGVGGWLVVSIVAEVSGAAEVWAWDGTAWWQLDSGTTLTYPVSIAGAATNADLLAWRAGANASSVYQLLPRSGALGYRSSFVVVSSLLDAGARDVDKAWRQAGVELAWPDERGTADSVTVLLEYSTNGGHSWATAATDSMVGTGTHTWTVSGELAAGSRSRWLQLRATVSSIDTWCPVVVGLWAEYETLSPLLTRRRWTLAVECRDRLVLRDGSVETTGARTTAASLWALWDAGDPVAFRDVDYDLAAVTYTVRLVAIAEQIPKPAEAGTWGDGVVTLTLVEV